MFESFLSAFLLLLLVIDPAGNAAPFTALTAGLPEARRRRVILRECLAGTAALLVCAGGGSRFLRLTGVQPDTLGITGGVLLFIIGLRMLFKGDSGVDASPSATPGAEPFLVPLATPLFAGPSAIAVVVINSAPGSELRWTWIAATLAAGLTATAALVFAEKPVRRLGPAGVEALSRLAGMILTAVATQMILDGLGRWLAQVR